MKNSRPRFSATLFGQKLLANGSSRCRPYHDKGRDRTHLLRQFLAPLLLVLLAVQLGQAQDVSTYRLAVTSGTFTPVTGGTTIATIAQYTATSPVIALPFTLYYGGTAYTSLQATSKGYIDLDNRASAFSTNALGYATNRIAPLWDDLDGTGGTASYSVTGTAPARVFTLQWLSWRWPAAASSANLSFQVKLYEGTNVIQFVYRPEAGAFTSADASATIGLEGGTYFVGDNNGYKNFTCLNDATPNAVLASNLSSVSGSVNTLNTRPVAGQTYTLTPLNDYCVHALPLAYGSTINGSTADASMASDPRAVCTVGGTGTPSNSPGVFYSLVGNGQTVTVSTCAGATATGGNTKLFVYSGSCGSFTCVGSNDDVLTGGCGTNPLASAVTFPTLTGTTYTVFVQYAQTGATGPFGLSVSGTPLATQTAQALDRAEVFPNPATRSFTLRLPALASERTAQITLFNSVGQQVNIQTVALNATGTQTPVDIQALPAGLYSVRVQAGAETTLRRLAVE